MSGSLIDRILSNVSVDGSGQLTRSVSEISTSGFIEDDAAHWSVEAYIPIETGHLKQYLRTRDEMSPATMELFDRFCGELESILCQRSATYHTRFSQLYTDVDPDMDRKLPIGQSNMPTTNRAGEVIAVCEQLLSDAGYRRLTDADIQQCVGVSSQLGVPMHVDFDLFRQLVVYARGDIVGSRLRRNWRKLYRNETVEIPIYQRLVLMFELADDHDIDEDLSAQKVHMRMFKNIPKQDVDTLLPGTRVRLSKIDGAKILVPSLGGFVFSIQKLWKFFLLFAAVTLYSSAILAGLILATIGYLIRSVVSYFQTKNRYLLHLTRNLYFQKLDANAGVGYRLIQQMNEQAQAEAIVAFFALVTAGKPVSYRKLRRRSERILREAINVEVDFGVERAIDLLREMDLVHEESADGRNVVSLRTKTVG